MTLNILFTSAGGARAADLFYQIKKKSIYQPLKIHATDTKKNIKIKRLVDSFNQVPYPTNKSYTKKIINIVKKNSIELVIPGSDEEAIKLSKVKKKLSRLGTDLACVDYKNLKFFKDKSSTYKKLDKIKIRKPSWKKVLNLKQLYFVVTKLAKKQKEMVIKPVFSRGGRNITVIRNDLNKKIISKNFGRERHMSKYFFLKHEYKKYFKKFPVIVMERLFEPNYDIDILAWKGRLIKYVIRRRIGPQGINGNVIEKNRKDFQIYVQKIAKIFHLSWLYDCDMMLDKNSRPVLMELNPRISGSLYASLAAGIPLVDDLISLSKKRFKKIKKTNIKKKIIIKPGNEPKDLRVTNF